jgi:hypothetical protein
MLVRETPRQRALHRLAEAEGREFESQGAESSVEVNYHFQSFRRPKSLSRFIPMQELPQRSAKQPTQCGGLLPCSSSYAQLTSFRATRLINRSVRDSPAITV